MRCLVGFLGIASIFFSGIVVETRETRSFVTRVRNASIFSRSTFSNPVVATCAHTFCKDCLNQVFQLRRCIECPLCRKDIKKRWVI